ncbi:thioredoxin family protein [Pedobacter sp. MC2016-14]|uniref:thioredoxin family protein n=1 Tax=Pedobacter sp. MC2016-14 TaxID=2897327 RepID=UPI001E551CCC|nr:thioredoxin family protein [Pedobacter sp. MC2016-14]MCD0487537.1 thioredoxin family protein [Pedobacter sp. MC2016-14]
MRKAFLTLTAILLISGSLFAQQAANTPPTAEQVLLEATALAKKEHKSVFIIFHASWCGWCHKMDDSMNDPAVKTYFDKSYVIRHLTVMEAKGKENLENPGASDLLKKYNSDGYGIPVWFIFDKNRKLLADSHIRPAGTGFEVKGSGIIGCPAAKEEVAEFIAALKKSSSLKENELAAIADRFSKNSQAGH